MKKKYLIQVYNDANIIHTEITEEISTQEIQKVVNTISEMIGKEYLIKYEEVEKEV